MACLPLPTESPQAGLPCPVCKARRVSVRYTKQAGNTIRRFRLCQTCGNHFITVEIVVCPDTSAK